MLKHALAAEEVFKLIFDLRKELQVFFRGHSILFLLLIRFLGFLGFDCADLVAEVVIDNQSVLQDLKGLLVLNDHLGEFLFVRLAKDEVVLGGRGLPRDFSAILGVLRDS